MLLSPIQISKHHCQMLELRLRTHPRQHMGSLLILVALPGGYVMIDIAGILVGPIEDKGMKAQLQLDG